MTVFRRCLDDDDDDVVVVLADEDVDNSLLDFISLLFLLLPLVLLPSPLVPFNIIVNNGEAVVVVVRVFVIRTGRCCNNTKEETVMLFGKYGPRGSIDVEC